MLDIARLKEQQQFMISYAGIIYQGTVKRIYPEYFLAEVNTSLNEQLAHITNGEYVGFSIELEEQICCCNSKIIGTKHEPSGMILVFASPAIEKTVEKRQYIRIPLSTRVDYCILPSYLESKPMKDIPSRFKNLVNMTKSESVDLSGGGVRVYTTTEYKLGELALIHMRLGTEIYVLGKVVRNEYIKPLRFRTAFQFINVEPIQKALIEKYVIDHIDVKAV